jgi:hypothetical protein
MDEVLHKRTMLTDTIAERAQPAKKSGGCVKLPCLHRAAQGVCTAVKQGTSCLVRRVNVD